MADRTGNQGSSNIGSSGSTQKSSGSSGSNVKTSNTGTSSKSGSMSTSGSSGSENFSSPGISHSSETAGSKSSTGSEQNLDGVLGLLQKLGMDDENWRRYVSEAVSNKVQEVEFRDVMERAKEYASMSGDKLKDLSTKNPKMFYGGLAAFILGAGMMASAAKLGDHSDSVDTPAIGKDPRPIV